MKWMPSLQELLTLQVCLQNAVSANLTVAIQREIDYFNGLCPVVFAWQFGTRLEGACIQRDHVFAQADIPFCLTTPFSRLWIPQNWTSVPDPRGLWVLFGGNRRPWPLQNFISGVPLLDALKKFDDWVQVVQVSQAPPAPQPPTQPPVSAAALKEDITKRLRTMAAADADRERYPHDCPRCGAPCFVGFTHIDCSRKRCGKR